MTYEIKNDPYLDPDTGIFVNKFGITDQPTLDAVEFELTSAQIASFEEDPVPGNFDLAHLKAIHKQIFGQLYKWGGELRTVDMVKDGTRFAHASHIESYANDLFQELRREHWLKGLDDAAFLERFSHYYSEINILHPFREGNGRTQRAFMSLLAMYSGYQVQWDQMYQDDNINASIAAYHGDPDPLEEILHPLLEWINENYFYFKSVGDGHSVVDMSLRDWPK
jgi:cell filamentation protein